MRLVNIVDLFIFFGIIYLVIKMSTLDNTIITYIEPPRVVHATKDRQVQITNRRAYGLSLCRSGQITYTMNGKNFVSTPDNAILLPKGGTYTLFTNKEGFFPLIDFDCVNQDINEITIIQLKNPTSALKKYEALSNISLYKKNNLEMLSAFYNLLCELSLQNSPKDSLLSPVIAYISQNISNPSLSNTELANQLGISEVYLRKLFYAHYKTTPKQYVLECRLKKAQQMLLETPFSITAIAEECGFSSLYHFCRLFKAKTGMTPTEYAKQNKLYYI